MELPEAINNFLNAKETFERRDQIMRPLSASLDATIKFTKTVNRLYDKEIGLNDLIPELIKATGFPEEMIKKMVLELAGYEFLPCSAHLGNVEEYIKSLGGDPAKYPATRITLRSLTPEEVVSELLHENTVPLPARLEVRLREILESFVRGVRSKDDTIHRLTRAEKIGGVALMDDEAEKIVNALAEKSASVKINFSVPIEAKPRLEEVSPQPPQQTAEVLPQQTTATSPQAPQPIFPAMTVKPPEIKREISLSDANVEFTRQLSSAAVRVAGAANVPIPKELNDRFMAIIVAMLKEARKPNETLETLKKSVVAGGMGFSEEVAKKTVDLLNAELGKIKLFAAELMKKEKDEFTKRQIQEAAEREKARQSAEAAGRDKIYGKLSGENPVAPRPEATPRLEEVSPQPLAAVVPAPSKAEPSAPATNPSPRALEQELGAGQAVLRAPSPRNEGGNGIALPPIPTLPPVAPQPKMQDIRKVAPRLTGPADELRNMNLSDFRLLSSDPVEACRKLNDKVLLLDEQSYAERAEGVKAWQESPLYKLYLSILNESFAGGGGVSAVIRARETSNKETLTEAELRAIMELNRHIKS